jgi:uncharacterized membrane protein YkoI
MKRLMLITALLLGAAPVTTATAGQPPAREASPAGAQVPLSSVLKKIAQQYPGKQLNTTMGQSGGRAVYLVQWQLTNGRIVVFTVDAQTGQVVGQ